MLQILFLHAYAASVGIRARLGSYHGTKRSMWGKTYCHRWCVWMRWGCTRCTIRGVLLTNRGVVWCAFKAVHHLSRWKSTSKLPSKSMFCGGGGGSWYRAGGLRYQRGWWIYWKNLSSRLGFSTNLWWLSWRF